MWLQEHKIKVLLLEERVAKVKSRYSIALRNLEQISEEIHAQRGRDPAEGRQTTTCGGRSPPVGAESDEEIQEEGGVYGGGATGKDRADGKGRADKANELVERYRERENDSERERERAGSDSLSVFSLQTIASDLEKCDSVEHLGDFSDVGSVTGDEAEKERGLVGRDRRDRETETTAKERQHHFHKQHHRSFSL